MAAEQRVSAPMGFVTAELPEYGGRKVQKNSDESENTPEKEMLLRTVARLFQEKRILEEQIKTLQEEKQKGQRIQTLQLEQIGVLMQAAEPFFGELSEEEWLALVPCDSARKGINALLQKRRAAFHGSGKVPKSPEPTASTQEPQYPNREEQVLWLQREYFSRGKQLEKCLSPVEDVEWDLVLSLAKGKRADAGDGRQNTNTLLTLRRAMLFRDPEICGCTISCPCEKGSCDC